MIRKNIPHSTWTFRWFSFFVHEVEDVVVKLEHNIAI